MFCVCQSFNKEATYLLMWYYDDNDEQLQMLLISFDMMSYFFYIFIITFSNGQIFASNIGPMLQSISPQLFYWLCHASKIFHKYCWHLGPILAIILDQYWYNMLYNIGQYWVQYWPNIATSRFDNIPPILLANLGPILAIILDQYW